MWLLGSSSKRPLKPSALERTPDTSLHFTCSKRKCHKRKDLYLARQRKNESPLHSEQSQIPHPQQAKKEIGSFTGARLSSQPMAGNQIGGTCLHVCLMKQRGKWMNKPTLKSTLAPCSCNMPSEAKRFTLPYVISSWAICLGDSKKFRIVIISATQLICSPHAEQTTANDGLRLIILYIYIQQ